MHKGDFYLVLTGVLYGIGLLVLSMKRTLVGADSAVLLVTAFAVSLLAPIAVLHFHRDLFAKAHHGLFHEHGNRVALIHAHLAGGAAVAVATVFLTYIGSQSSSAFGFGTREGFFVTIGSVLLYAVIAKVTLTFKPKR